MKRLYIIFLIIAVCLLANCAPPFGTLYGSGGAAGATMWIIPNRVLYDTENDNMFSCANDESHEADLRIYYMKDEIVQSINPMIPAVEIEIRYVPISNTDDPGQWIVKDPPNNKYHHVFENPGRYEVHVKYQGREAFYSVEVRGYGTGTIPADDFGTYVKWLPPKPRN